MNRLPLAFFSAAALCALSGMIWGAVMGATQDFSLAPAHAHLNLVGWATLALMGTFYQLSGRSGPLGWLNFALSAGAAAIMGPVLGLMLAGDRSLEPAVMVSSTVAILGMGVFVVVVLSSWRTARA